MSESDKRNEWQIRITPGHAARNYFQDLWRFRELFIILSWRDLKVRYKQTFIGVAWSVLRPLLTTLIFTYIFSRVAHLGNPGKAPYMLMVFAGMIPWQFFSNALSESSNSLVSNSNLITKVYFPRMIIPASSVVTSLADLLISLGLMMLLFAFFGFMPPWQVIFLPLMLLMAFACAFGAGLLLTALNVKYRDFRYILPFIIQFGLYISPVGFTSAVFSENSRLLYSLNPMVGVIDGFRWCLLGDPLNIQSFLISLAVIFFLLISGILYFRATERSFADNI